MTTLTPELARQQQIRMDSKRRLLITKYSAVAVLLAPGLIFLFVFLLLPVIKSAYFSFWTWNGLGGLEKFVGFDNYARIVGQKIFQGAVLHSIIILVLSLAIQLPLSLVLALLLTRGKIIGKRFFRSVFFVPFVFSEVITAIIWMYVYHPNNGLVNMVLKGIIPGFENQAFLANSDTVLLAIFFVITWKYFGFYLLLYMAGLQQVSQDTEDAARIDGASEFNVLRYITIPTIGSTLRLTVYLSMLGSLQQFIIVWILTEGGPVFRSEVMVTYLYKFGLQRLALGYGSAVAVIMFAMTFVMSLGYQRIIMKRDYADAE